MAQYGVVVLVHAALQYFNYQVLEGIGVVEVVEVDDGVVLDGGFKNFVDEGFGFAINGGTCFDINYFVKKAHDELSHLFLMFAKRWVVLEFIVDVAAYGGEFFVEVFGESLYGLAHKFVEVEAHTAYGLAQQGVDGFAFVGFKIADDAGNEVGGCG